MARDFSEIGSTGLNQWRGIVTDDFLTEWRGIEKYKRVEEMRLNSPVIAVGLLAIELSIRHVDWNITSNIGDDDERVAFVSAAMDAMSYSWREHVVEALSFLAHGFSMFEIVYRAAEDSDGDDLRGRITWRKFAPRGQDTVSRWLISDDGGIDGVEQQAAPDYKIVEIPIEKMILYRTRLERGNPEGRSLLRPAWIPYYYCKNIQRVEGIGVERDLAGLPYIKLPDGATTDLSDSSSDASVAAKIVRNMRRDEQAGIVTKHDWEIGLLTTGGSRQIDTDVIIRRYESRQLLALLSQFLLLGQDRVGTQALSGDLSDFFSMAVDSAADIISDTMTKHVIPRLLEINGMETGGLSMSHSPASDTNLGEFSAAISQLLPQLTIFPEDEQFFRSMFGLPEIDIETIRQERDKKEAFREQLANRLGGENGSSKDEPENDKDGSYRSNMSSLADMFAATADGDDRKRRAAEKDIKNRTLDYWSGLRSRILRGVRR